MNSAKRKEHNHNHYFPSPVYHHMTRVILRIHPSIKLPDVPLQFEGEFENVPLIQAISTLLQPYPAMAEQCLNKNKKKPGILYISEGSELGSLGLLDAVIGEEEEIEVRVVPILHGG